MRSGCCPRQAAALPAIAGSGRNGGALAYRVGRRKAPRPSRVWSLCSRRYVPGDSPEVGDGGVGCGGAVSDGCCASHNCLCVGSAVESVDEHQPTALFSPFPETSHRPRAPPIASCHPCHLCGAPVRASAPGGSDPASVTFMSSVCILYLCIINIISLWSTALPGYPHIPWARLFLNRRHT